jgi:hypothetical protein
VIFHVMESVMSNGRQSDYGPGPRNDVERHIPVGTMLSFNDLEVALKDHADVPRKLVSSAKY